MPEVRCKPKHRAISASTPGLLRGPGDLRSRCPGWASPALQRELLAEVLVDPDAGNDLHGRPRKLWNAIRGTVFVGVSSGEPIAAYNCYPEAAVTSLAPQLKERAKRGLDALGAAEDDHG